MLRSVHAADGAFTAGEPIKAHFVATAQHARQCAWQLVLPSAQGGETMVAASQYPIYNSNN